MRPPALLAAAAAALPGLAGAARLREGRARPRAALVSRRPCAPAADGAGLLQRAAAGTGGVFADGYSRVGCEVDVAPESERVYFKDHACGNVSSCRLLELPMQPRLCFDFCRTQETAHFFGLVHGRDCYCGTYFHAHSTGGQGECDRQCEGNAEEMCGGKTKSSLFEMHTCGDSKDEADIALEAGEGAAAESTATVELASRTAAGLRGLADAWRLQVCSVEPEGQRVCSLTGAWVAAAGKLTEVVSSAGHAGSLLAEQAARLAERNSLLDTENATALSQLELLSEEVLTSAGKVKGEVAVANNTINALAGPMRDGTRPLETWATNFETMSPQDGWSAVCALTALPGKAFAAMAVGQQPQCAARCMDLGVSGGCVAFNYQEKDGLSACQLLSGMGVVEPQDSLLAKVPIFEVSDTKRGQLGIQSMGCHANRAFLAGHPRGPLNYTVIRSVTV